MSTNNSEIASRSTAIVNNNKVDEERSQSIWFNEEGGWELTWPIWHMLPRDERRSIAQNHGCKTIGEFEELMVLQRAVSSTASPQQTPYENRLIYIDRRKAIDNQSLDEGSKSYNKPDETEDDNSVNKDGDLDEEIQNEYAAAADKLPTKELLKRGGAILRLAEDMLHRVFEWLPVDTYATLALVSPHWKSFTRTEAAYKRLCERLYLNQSKRRVLHVSQFGNSYRTMLEKRPRVRAMGGVYVMKYARVKKIERDMFTEVRASLCHSWILFRLCVVAPIYKLRR
jgi:F-box protein 9